MRRAFVLMAITGVNIVALFVYQWFVVVKLGAGPQSDAVFASMVLPQVILNVVSGSLAFVLVPMLATTDDGRFHTEISNFLAALGMLFGAVGLLLFVSVDLWVPLTVPGFSANGKEITESLARVQLIGMFFTGVGAVGQRLTRRDIDSSIRRRRRPSRRFARLCFSYSRCPASGSLRQHGGSRCVRFCSLRFSARFCCR